MSTQKKVNVSQILYAVVMAGLGVLFCLNIATDVVSIVIGAMLCAFGLVNLILFIAAEVPIASIDGVFNGLLIALGIVFIKDRLISVVVGWVPFILAVVGVIIILDAFLAKFMRKDVLTAGFVTELSVGVLTAALGFCLIFIEGFKTAASIIFGIVLILGAIYSIVMVFLGKSLVKGKSKGLNVRIEKK